MTFCLADILALIALLSGPFVRTGVYAPNETQIENFLLITQAALKNGCPDFIVILRGCVLWELEEGPKA
jgi:hypothetical protein